MWTIPPIPTDAHDIDVHRPERPAKPANDPNRRSDSRRRPHDADSGEDGFEIDTFEPQSDGDAVE